MNTMTAERPPAKAPRMRYPEQALAELKLEDPNTPVTVYMIRGWSLPARSPRSKWAAGGCLTTTRCWSTSHTLFLRRPRRGRLGSAG